MKAGIVSLQAPQCNWSVSYYVASSYISDFDKDFIRTEKEKCLFYAVIGNAETDVTIENDAGTDACYPEE